MSADVWAVWVHFVANIIAAGVNNKHHFVANNIGPDRVAYSVSTFVSESKPQSKSNLFN